MKERNSNVELLKVFAMFGIVVSHVVQSIDKMQINGTLILNQNARINDATEFIMFLMRNLGQIGNIIFLVCSAWFLIDSNKASLKKTVGMILDNFLISVIMLVAFSILGYGNVDWVTMIKLLLPTTFGMNWFITCYLLLFAIHPLLNRIISDMSQKTLLGINAILLILYGNMNVVDGNIFFYSQIIGFIWIYFIVAYIKKYMKSFVCSRKYNIFLLMIGIIGYIILIFSTQILSFYFAIFQNKMLFFSRITNPFFIMIAVALFNMAYNHKTWINTKINYLSSISMLIYVIHQNYFMITVIRPRLLHILFEKNAPNMMILVAIVASILIYLVSVCAGILYKQIIQRNTTSIVCRITEMVRKAYDNILSCLLKSGQ